MHSRCAWALVVLSSMGMMTAASAQDRCDGRPFGAVEKRGMEDTPAPDDKWFPVDDHVAAQRPHRGLTQTSWGWGCSTTLVVDLDRALAAQIHRCRPGSSDDDALWAGFAKRAQVMTQRVLQNGDVLREAVETRQIDPAQMAAFTCLANKVWHDALPPPQGQPPVPPHSVSYLRLWDGQDVKFIGGFHSPDPEAGELAGMAYRWFKP